MKRRLPFRGLVLNNALPNPLWGFTGSLGSAPRTLLSDTFTGTDGTLLNVHTPDQGPAWSAQGTNFQLSSNQCVATASALTFWDTADVSNANVTVACDAVFSAGGTLNGDQVGLVLRFQDTSNYWLAQFFWGAGAILRIVEVLAGSSSVPATTTWTPVNGTTYRLAFRALGTAFSAYVNGVQQCTCTSSDLQSQTKVGMRCALAAGQNHFTIDNFLCTTP